MERVITYIDGFNLYFGLCAAKWRRYLWLDVRRLSLSLLKPGQMLVGTKYFTSRVSDTPSDPRKSKRQGAYLEALETLLDVYIFYGHYLQKQVKCQHCNSVWSTYEEKMTDVNIAVEMMTDCHLHAFDVALIISGDSDLTGPVEAIRSLYSDKRTVIAFPPRRHSMRLQTAAHAFLTIGRRHFHNSQLPDKVLKQNGHVLEKPGNWA